MTDRTGIDQPTFQVVSRYFVPVSVKKNQVLTAIGDTCYYLYFVKKGGLRFYYLDKKGGRSHPLFCSGKYVWERLC